MVTNKTAGKQPDNDEHLEKIAGGDISAFRNKYGAVTSYTAYNENAPLALLFDDESKRFDTRKEAEEYAKKKGWGTDIKYKDSCFGDRGGWSW